MPIMRRLRKRVTGICDIRERALEKLKGVLSAEELAAFGFKAEPEKVWARGGC